jgi:hypothetical protein
MSSLCVGGCFPGSARILLSPKYRRSQPAANRKDVTGNKSIRIARFRIRKSLCALNLMPGRILLVLDISLVKHCGVRKLPETGVYVES